MELTKHELEIADRHLSKREKQLANWPRTRWLMLVIFLVMVFIGYRNLRDGMRTIDDDKTMDMQVRQSLEKDPPPGLEHRWSVGCMLKISKVLELRHQEVTYSLMQVGLGYVQSILAVTFLSLTILRWNRTERDALICKLLRGRLEELKQAER